MRRVIVESPFAGDVEKNLRYLRACMADCFARGEAPFASHAIYTQPGVLDDGKPEDRTLGITAGFEWRESAEATVVYTDLGMSKGMEWGIQAAIKVQAHRERLDNHPIEYRQLGEGWEERAIAREASFATKWSG